MFICFNAAIPLIETHSKKIFTVLEITAVLPKQETDGINFEISIYCHGFQCGLWTTDRGIHEVRPSFIITLKCYAPYSLCWHLRWQCENTAKISGTWAQVKVTATSAVHNTLCAQTVDLTTHSQWKTNASVAKNIFDEELKCINFITYQPLSTCLCNILCGQMGRMKQDGCLEVKLLCDWLFWVSSWTSFTFHEPSFSRTLIFTWKNKWQSIVLTWGFADVFSTTRKVNSGPAASLVHDKIGAFNKNKNFGKLVSVHSMSDIFSILKDLSYEVVSDINKHDFL